MADSFKYWAKLDELMNALNQSGMKEPEASLILKLSFEACSIAREEGYRTGYDDGFQCGSTLGGI